VDLDRQRDLDLTLREQLHRTGPPHKTLLLEPFAVHHGVRRELRQLTGVQHLIRRATEILEAALRQPPLHRHLPAFEPHWDLAARARLVALVSLARGAAEARRRALAAALLRLRRARCRANLSE